MSRQVQSVYRDAYEDTKLHREKVIAKRQKIETLRALLEMHEVNPDHDHEYVLALRARLRSAQKSARGNEPVTAVMTEADFRKLFPRSSVAFSAANQHLVAGNTPKSVSSGIVARSKAKPRKMTNPELEDAFILEKMKREGEIESWKYEGVTLKLADGCRYCPDFFIVVSSLILRLRFVEIKGRHVWEDSIVKFKVAKEQNPWAEWQLHQRTKAQGWTRLL